MNNRSGRAASSRHDRRFRRFRLRYPVHLAFQFGNTISEADAISRNISTGGLLLDCPVLVPEQSSVSFVISLSARKLRPLKLMGEGTVVRVETGGMDMEFGIAIECKRQIMQIEPYLAAPSR
jgi:PilZ domain